MRILLTVFLCFTLSACGVKPGKLKTVPGFPASYPQPETVEK